MHIARLCLPPLLALLGATAVAAQPSLAPEVVNAARAWNAPPSAALILRTQILLDRAHFAPGEIDAAAGTKLRKALAAFQRQQGLDPTGAMDSATWDALNRDTAPALVPYEIQAADLAGPFEPVPQAMLDKASLPYLGYATALEGLAEKFHASPALLRRLNPGKDFDSEGAGIVVPNVLDSAPLPRAGRIVVDRSDSVLALYDADG
ncbi:MAG TPA: peptidoglycan-binding domain-containing protein, partial [Telluria sp.]|nr:peptidoglycan-binding domain-containing protein [Telluria sp.]